MSKGKKILIGVIVLIAVIVIIGKNSNKNDDAFSNLPYPKDQIALINASTSAITKGKEAKNDMQKGSALNERNKAICAELKSLSVKDWVGVISKIDSNSDGRGVLYVEISKDVYLNTWNNDLSDVFHNTLLKPDTDLFNTVSNLKKGQAVKFSGTLFPDQQTCIFESSLSLDGKLKEPEFIFRFTDVSPL